MNTKIIALTLAATTAFAFTPKPAVAGDKDLAIVGGILGGILIASAINDHHDDHRTVVVSNGYRHSRDDGYWKTVKVRVWVPGGWVYERSHHHGRSHRRYVAGHYECRTDRVWVASNHHDRRDDRHDRRDIGRGYGRGYGRDRDDWHDRDDRHDRNDRDYRR